MAELTRFTLVRDVERREPRAGTRIPLIPSSVIDTPPLLAELAEATTSESVQASCSGFLSRGEFLSPDTIRDHPLGRFSSWLRARGDRATVAEILIESPIRSILSDNGGVMTHVPDDNLWTELRVKLAMSFLVALLVPNSDPKVAPAIQRLLLTADLAAALYRRHTLGATPNAVDARDSARSAEAAETEEAERNHVHAALHLRFILLPDWLSRYPELTRRTSEGMLRRSRLVREPAMSDYYVVEDEWHRYEAAEIAHIENLLPHETKRRTHVRQTETETTAITETERIETTEKDTQQTDSTEFSVATQSEMELSFGADLSVDTQGQYGPTAVQTHLAAEIDGSLQTAEQTAFRVAREVTTRAGSKVSERNRTTRTTRALTRITETNLHKLDNGESDDPVAGVYRWVEQVRRMRVMRYPNRYLLEFLVPEPAAWWRWLNDRAATRSISMPEPTPFTANGQKPSESNSELTAADMLPRANDPTKPPPYLKYAGRYGTVGLEPPPQTQVIATAIARSPGLKTTDGVTTIPKAKNEFSLEWNKDATLTVPGGWEATTWKASILAWHDGSFNFNNSLGVSITVGAGPALSTSVGEGQSMIVQLNDGEVGPISTGTVPAGVMLDAPYGYNIAIEVTCQPTEAAVARWQQRTYESVRQAFSVKEAEYREAVSAAETRAGVTITGLSPARAREVERTELKKHIITLMRGRGPEPAIEPWARDPVSGEPELKTDQIPRDELLFLEQSLEWENMRYVHYPYFWADSSQWDKLADLSTTDPLFAAFLRAGSTRVVVPARPSFEAAVCFYTETLIPWGGLGAPAPDKDGYLSIADEVAALSRGPKDGTQVGPSWEIRLPTELTCLATDDLPKNASGRIPAPPK